MILSVHETLEALLALKADWQSLQDEIGTVPFTSWEWNVAWWNHLARRTLVTRDRLHICTFRDESGRLIAVAPLILTEVPAVGLRLRCLQFVGADPNLTEIRGLLCRKSDEPSVYETLLRSLFGGSRDVPQWDYFLMAGLSPEGGVAGKTSHYARPLPLDDLCCFVLEVPSTWDEFRRTRSRNIKESLRKCTNSLKRDGIVPTFHVAKEGAALRSAVASVVRLHSARSTRTDTIFHPNVFQTQAATDFVEEVCQRHSERDAVRVITMDIDGKTVAARIIFLIGKTAYLYYSGYDPAFARYSVMTSVTAEAIKHSIEQGCRTVNLSTGSDVSKTRWSPTAIRFQQVALPSASPLSRLGMLAYLKARTLYHATKLAQDRARVRLSLGEKPEPQGKTDESKTDDPQQVA